MDLSTRYLGLDLQHPLIVGAGPIGDDLDLVRRAEDAGAAAIVMRSLFEEQLHLEQVAVHRHTDSHAESSGEALSYLPTIRYAMGPDEYLQQLARVREAVGIPVVASLNGHTDLGWLEYARLLEQAGASAIELCVFDLPTRIDEAAEHVEARVADMVRHVTSNVTVPVAVKLLPFWSSLPEFVKRLEKAGASGVVLFNRFLQPDMDVAELVHVPTLSYSDSCEIGLRLRWVGILAGRVKLSLAVSGAVHEPVDAIKAVLAGADAIQMVSALLKRGPEHVAAMRVGLGRWLEEMEYASLAEAKGSMSLERCPDPNAYSRGSYVRILQSWRLRTA